MKKMLAVGVAALALAGCAKIEIPSRLYDMKGGKVIPASFLWKGDVSGPTTIQKDDETCQGEYRSIIEGRTSVGVGAAAGAWGTIFGSLYSASSVERAQKGIAIAMCPSGMTFECEYITNVSFTTVSGHGACKDNRDGSYRLMF